jgi:spore coat protein U-like protein
LAFFLARAAQAGAFCITFSVLSSPNFGTVPIGTLGENVLSSARFQERCIPFGGIAPYVTLDYGLYAVGTQRYLAGATTPANRIAYGLYQDAPRSIVWGNTQATGVPVANDARLHTYTVYAMIAAGGVVPNSQDTYSDTVTATLNY